MHFGEFLQTNLNNSINKGTIEGETKLFFNQKVLGKLARENAPFITQWIVNIKEKERDIEALLFRLRQRISNRANVELKEDELGLYICSLSNKTIVYKGMVRSEILAELCRNQNEITNRRSLLIKVWGDDSFFNSRN